jgi:hypothetical protein
VSVARDAGDLLDRIALGSPAQRLLRALVVLGAVLLLATIPAAGGRFHPLLSTALLLLAVAVAVVPETHVGIVLLLGLGGLWAISVPDRLDGWLLLAAAELLLVHLAATLASYGPAGHRPDAALLALWGRRAVGCLAAAAGGWLVARTLTFLHLPGSRLALAAALLVLLAWVGVLSARIASRREGPVS